MNLLAHWELVFRGEGEYEVRKREIVLHASERKSETQGHRENRRIKKRERSKRREKGISNPLLCY